MSELAIVAATMKVRLREISNQAKALATALHNAAPGDKKPGVPNNSIEYLFNVAESLAESADKCEKTHQPPEASPNKPEMR